MDGGFITVTVTGVSIASGVASASATIPNMSSGEKPRFIRIAASQAAYVRVGPGAQTAVNTDLQVQPGDAVILQIPSGVVTIAALQVSVAGVVQVSPLENM